MATRRPLVTALGIVREIPSGDVLPEDATPGASVTTLAPSATTSQSIAVDGADHALPLAALANPSSFWNAGTQRFTPTRAGTYAVSVLSGTGYSPDDGSTVLSNWIGVMKNGSTPVAYAQGNSWLGYVPANGVILAALNGSTDYLNFVAGGYTLTAVASNAMYVFTNDTRISIYRVGP